MTEAEIMTLLAAVDECREAIAAALPLDSSAAADTGFEMGFSLATLKNLEFLLQRDLRAKQLPQAA